MSDLVAFLEVGFRHIVNPQAIDHLLFLLALAAIYRVRDWRDTLWVVTAFTVGHSLTLALSATDVLVLPGRVIEFLIPVTIAVTGVENLLVADRTRAPWRGRYRPVFAAVFGLVHGAGFAGYLRSLFIDHITLPLLGFNIGIELGQIAVLLVVFTGLAGLDAGIAALGTPTRAPSPFRLRVVAVSAVVALVAARWAVERSPW